MTASRRARFTACFVALTGGLMIFAAVLIDALRNLYGARRSS